METPQLLLPPVTIEVDGYLVDIIEVLKLESFSGSVTFSVSVRINYKGIKSRVFSLDVRNESELIKKLKIEITKIKFMELTYGLDEVRRIISGGGE